MTDTSAFQRLKRLDESRSSFPAEHWLVLGLGVAALAYAARRRSTIRRSIATTLGTGLIARAMSGRDALRPRR